VKVLLLSVVAAGLAVKQALTGPLSGAAQPELEHVKKSLDEKTKPALAQAGMFVDQAGTHVVGAVIKTPARATSGGSPAQRGTPVASPTQTAAPAALQAQAAGLRLDTGEPRSRASQLYSRALVRKILRQAAVRHGVDPKLVLALSYWESGWDQSRVSETGAVGLMQVQPATAQEAGPALLGHAIDLGDPYDNADIGCAILRADLDAFKDPVLGLAAYYQGPTSLRENGMFDDTQAYVEGIQALAAQQNP
jgi:soluble lytic murein transglycosylase-like protein